MKIPMATGLAALLFGCATKSSGIPDQIAKAKAAHPQVASISLRLVLPAPVPYVAWDHPGLSPDQYFEVWSTLDLGNGFTLATNTTDMSVKFPIQPSEFYRVRTVSTNGVRSDWGSP